MILVFDPGVSTGVAVLTPEGNIVSTAVLRDVDEIYEVAVDLNERYPNSDVVIEAPPQWGGNYRPLIQRIEEDLRRVFPDAHWVNPGQWKGHPAARPTQDLRGKTQHEKDTVCLGRWFKSTQRRHNATAGDAESA